MKGPVDIAQHGTAEEDLVTNPYSRLEEAFDKKRRNLEKRKIRLQQYEEDKRKGKQLSEEQKEAVSRLGEVDSQLEYVKDLTKMLAVQRKDYNRVNKQRDDANRKKNLEHDHVLLAQFLYYQAVFKMLESKHIIEALTEEGNLSPEEMQLLDELSTAFRPVLPLVEKTDMWLPALEENACVATAVLVGTKERVLETLNGAKARELLEKVSRMKAVQNLRFALLLSGEEQSSELHVTLSELSITMNDSTITTDTNSAGTAVSETAVDDLSMMYSGEHLKRKPQTESDDETEPEPESEPIKKDPKVVFVQSETDHSSCCELESNTEFGYVGYTVEEPDDTPPVTEEMENSEAVARDPPPPIPLPQGVRGESVHIEQSVVNGTTTTYIVHEYDDQPVWAPNQDSESKAETASAPKGVHENGEQHPRAQRGGMRRGRGRGGIKHRNGAPLKADTAAEGIPANPPKGARGGRDFGGRPGGRRSPRGYRGTRGARGTAAGYGATANGNVNSANAGTNNGYNSYDYASSHPPRQAGFNFANDRRK